jgi:hypothetical protein
MALRHTHEVFPGDGTQRRTAGKLVEERLGQSEQVADFVVSESLSPRSGYFQLGPDVICYGQCSCGVPAESVTGDLHDALKHVVVSGSSIHLPFDPVQIVDNLRYERYYTSTPPFTKFLGDGIARKMYYRLRPMLGVSARAPLQKLFFRGWEKIPFPKWPVDLTVDRVFEQLTLLLMRSLKVVRLPFIWFWPEGAQSCTMMTHDVEAPAGRDFCSQLMDLDAAFEIKSAFQIVPEERYHVSELFLENIRRRGFEVNVHDSNHDGLLFGNREEFLRRSDVINGYGRRFGAKGFRSGALYRNADWYDALDFSYDMSIPNVAHLEPQRGGCCTVLPFFVGNILELPVTTTQDYTLFHILNDYSLRLWKHQISIIRQNHGLISFIIHPDYIMDVEARRVYADLLGHLYDLRSRGETWIALPGEIAAWWRLRSKLKLTKRGDAWRIDGHGSERARVAYAVLENDSLRFEFAS